MGKIDHPSLHIRVAEEIIKPIVMEIPIGGRSVTHPAINAGIISPIEETLAISFGYGFELDHGENFNDPWAEEHSLYGQRSSPSNYWKSFKTICGAWFAIDKD